MMKQIILCADDYGQNEAISQAIINLIQKKRITATSCMTNAPNWSLFAKWLLPYLNQIDLGLHFNLTEGKSLTDHWQMLPVSKLIIKSHLRLIKERDVINELHKQLDLFQETLGRLPDFIDGHQHVHHMPIIRNALFKVYEERLSPRCYIRSVYAPSTFFQMTKAYLKTCVVQVSGAMAFKKKLVKRNIPHNLSFAGFYNFKTSSYRLLFNQFARLVQDKGMIMCHPGLNSEDGIDHIQIARSDEYEYLVGDQFLKDCEFHQLALMRFK